MSAPGDWEVVEEALDGDFSDGAAALAALARLREREAQLRELKDANWNQAVKAEARVAELEREASEMRKVFAEQIVTATSRVTRLEEALRSLEAEGWFAAWSDDPRVVVIRRALAHEEEA